VYGNKGAIALGIDVVDPETGKIASLCFVTVHLQAHEGNAYMHARNGDMRQVFDCLVMHGEEVNGFRNNHPYDWIVYSLWPGMSGVCEDVRMIESYETCWIFGDFNYRFLEGVFTRAEILETIKAKGLLLF
jgi:hypothetical protein